jgi:formate--tetrahydrofolate ligase
MRTDIEIAQQAHLRPIVDIAKGLGIEEEELETYGRYKAKVSLGVLDRLKGGKDGRLVLVTAMTPTAAGEGKTTVSIGLGEAMHAMGLRVCNTLREPSLGPVFGVKGGAAGGGRAQVVPMEDINLHFTGDIHAVTAANNLLAAMVDNHIQKGNELGIDPKRVTLRRAMDMNDRALREIVVGLGGPADGVARPDGFLITAASEVMAILCLANDLQDLRRRLGEIVVGFTRDRQPVRARDLRAHGAMTVLLKDALKPNLVQTLEGSPALVHGGPFGNIAHGTNSLVATRMALKLADYVVIETGFGADLGAEKFVDIVCRQSGLRIDAAVIVATCRALKLHGGVKKDRIGEKDVEALKRGIPNLMVHIENVRGFGVPVVVALNVFSGDAPEELREVELALDVAGVRHARATVYEEGGEGGRALATEVLEALKLAPQALEPVCAPDLPIKEKLDAIATRIYRADGVTYDRQAEADIKLLERLGFGALPVCVAKTQNSLSDDPRLRGVPKGWRLTVNEVRLSAGAGFLVAVCGEVMLMPGLPTGPAAEGIDVDASGKTVGLF